MLLDSVNTPDDLKQLNETQLQELSLEIRDFLIENTHKTGGHLASNLGVVDLTLCLHYIFNAPKDSIVFDVGHQAYTHKILTGRKDNMATIRQTGGLSGFTNRAESPYDTFGAGHSSTSISAALGIAISNKITNNNQKSIAIIGDGSLTGGMSFEALNHAGDSGADILIIVNDNEMSISKNVGGLSKHLTNLISGKIYGAMKDTSMKILDKTPTLKKFAQKSEEHFKGMFMPSAFFEELGIEYFGPIDGHNQKELLKTLTNIKDKNHPRVLHIKTKKGYGLEVAENNPNKFHGISAVHTKNCNNPSFSQVFGDWLLDNGDDEKLLAITPAMSSGSGMDEFATKFPGKYFDVGIAEQHAITFAGGLATQGFKPIVAIYSTFLQRGYDQFIHDIALQNLPVTFAIDRAGIVGADGATHNGCFDMSFLLPIPNIILATPSNGKELYQMLNTAKTSSQPFCIRYPRGKTNKDFKTSQVLEIGKAQVVLKGSGLAIFAFGTMVDKAIIAGKTLGATVINMRFAKPLDEHTIIEIANTHNDLISIEEGSIIGGVGNEIARVLQKYNLTNRLAIKGIPDEWIEHGSQNEIYEALGLTSQGIIKEYEAMQQSV
jgi:1-deoxy-D-xylulose-5-phosphate synthase